MGLTAEITKDEIFPTGNEHTSSSGKGEGLAKTLEEVPSPQMQKEQLETIVPIKPIQEPEETLKIRLEHEAAAERIKNMLVEEADELAQARERMAQLKEMWQEYRPEGAPREIPRATDFDVERAIATCKLIAPEHPAYPVLVDRNNFFVGGKPATVDITAERDRLAPILRRAQENLAIGRLAKDTADIKELRGRFGRPSKEVQSVATRMKETPDYLVKAIENARKYDYGQKIVAEYNYRYRVTHGYIPSEARKRHVAAEIKLEREAEKDVLQKKLQQDRAREKVERDALTPEQLRELDLREALRVAVAGEAGDAVIMKWGLKKQAELEDVLRARMGNTGVGDFKSYLEALEKEEQEENA